MDKDLETKLDKLAAQVQDMHDVFFEVPKGSNPETTKTFYQELQTIVKAWNNSSWAFRMASYLIGGVLFLGTAISTMGEWSWLPWNR